MHDIKVKRSKETTEKEREGEGARGGKYRGRKESENYKEREME